MAITGCQLQNVTAARRQLGPLVGGPRAAPARSVPSTRRRPGFRGRSIPSHEGANYSAPVARVCGQEAGRLQAPVTAHSYPEASGPGNTPQPASLRCCQNGERPVQEEPSRRQGRSGNHARQPPRPAGPGQPIGSSCACRTCALTDPRACSRRAARSCHAVTGAIRAAMAGGRGAA
jgi:hypothetical protein